MGRGGGFTVAELGLALWGRAESSLEFDKKNTQYLVQWYYGKIDDTLHICKLTRVIVDTVIVVGRQCFCSLKLLIGQHSKID